MTEKDLFLTLKDLQFKVKNVDLEYCGKGKELRTQYKIESAPYYSKGYYSKYLDNYYILVITLKLNESGKLYVYSIVAHSNDGGRLIDSRNAYGQDLRAFATSYKKLLLKNNISVGLVLE